MYPIALVSASNDDKEGLCVRSTTLLLTLAEIYYVSPKSSIQLWTTLYRDDYTLYIHQYGQVIYEAWPNTGEQFTQE
jgi:hypothetical protein